MARPGNGSIDGLPPMRGSALGTVLPGELEAGVENEVENDAEDELAGADIGAVRGGMDGDFGAGDMGFKPGTSGPVLTSVMRVSTRRVSIFHSPHQSSSRTCGQTPSIM